MKSILYVGATLMIGAGIYGFVDYKKTNHKKEFAKMYDSNEVFKPVPDIKPKDISEKAVPGKKENVIKEQSGQKDKSMKENSVITTERNLPSETTSDISLKEMISKYDKPVKKLNYKLFSRAPLERKYLEKEFKLEQLKTGEPGKIIPKDSL